MVRSVALLSLAASGMAFQAPSAVRSSSRGALQMMAGDMSKSLPFLKRPTGLDGSMVGDVGFDPLGLTDNIDLSNARAAELKHGRVAMLAVVGFALSQFVHLPGEAYSNTNPFGAVTSVPLAANVQIFMAIAVIELATIKKQYAEDTTPGDFGFDPLNFSKGKSDAQLASMQLKELKNGRLAMMAIMGMFVQTLLFGKTF